MNSTLHGNDLITKDNMDLVKDYLNSNFTSVSVDFELSEEEDVYIIIDGQKYQLFENTTVGDLVSSFDQMYGKEEDSTISDRVDNSAYYSRNRRNRVQTKEYRININEELYKSFCSKLESLSSDISTSATTYDASMFTEKLERYYNSLGVDNNKDIDDIKNVIDDLNLKIKYSLELYSNTDQDLQYFFNSMVNQVFAYDDFKNGGSIEYLSVEERAENLRNYINYLSETYDSVYNEYLKLYCNGEDGKGILLTEDAGQLLYGLSKSFNLHDQLGCYGATEDGHDYIDINVLVDTVSFIKENNVLDKLTKYTNGDSWEESGMSELNYYILGFTDQGYMDRHRENEACFLATFLDNQDDNFIENVRGKYDYQTAFSIFYDSDNPDEAIALLKDRIKKQISSFNLSDTEELIANKNLMENTVASLASQVYNLKQYETLMPYDEIKKDPEFLKYLGKNYDASGEYGWYDQTELAIYHYVYDKDGFDAANKYLKAMEDTVNQRKGFVAAAKYVELLNSGHETADIISELSPIMGTLTDGFVTMMNTGISGTDGFVTGLFTFGKGFYNLVHADGVRDVSDYAIMFKAQLMSEKNELNENMEDWQRELYYHNNQIMSSIGNMIIPCILSSVGAPLVGKAALFLSSWGNAAENTMQEGYSGAQAYLYGALSASLELATESILGSLPGLGGNAPENLGLLKGVDFLKALGMSMLDEGKEEFIQTYAEACLKFMVLGEPIDLSQTTSEAIQSFIYGAISSGIMNLGTVIPVRLKNGNVVNIDITDIDKIQDAMVDAGIISQEQINVTSALDYMFEIKGFELNEETINNNSLVRIMANISINDIDISTASPEVLQVLNQKIISEQNNLVQLVNCNLSRQYMSTYISNNVELMSQLSTENLIRLTCFVPKADYMKIQDVIVERISNGETINFTPIEYDHGFGMKRNDVDSFLGKLSKNAPEIYDKIMNGYIESYNQNVPAEVRQMLDNDGMYRYTKGMIASLFENNLIDERGISVLTSFGDNATMLNSFDYNMLNPEIMNDLGVDFAKDFGRYPTMSTKLIDLKNNNPNTYNALKTIINDLQVDTSLQTGSYNIKNAVNFLFDNATILEGNIGSYDAKTIMSYANLVDTFGIEAMPDLSSDFQSIMSEKNQAALTEMVEKVDNGGYVTMSSFKDTFFAEYFSMNYETDFNMYRGDNIVNAFATNLDYIKANLSNPANMQYIEMFETMLEIHGIEDQKVMADLCRSDSNVHFTAEDVSAMKEALRQEYVATYLQSFDQTNEVISANSHMETHNGQQVEVVDYDGDFAFFVHSSDTGFTEDKVLVNGSFKDTYHYTSDAQVHGVSTSFITQDNIGSAPVGKNGVLYGFTNLNSSDVQLMGTTDINSNIANYGFTSSRSQFVVASDMSNETYRIYNEVELNRDTTNPSCVVLYSDASPEVMANSYKAAAEWNIPVVKIDVDAVAQNQVANIQSNLSDYKATKNIDSLNNALKGYEAGVSGFNLNATEADTKFANVHEGVAGYYESLNLDNELLDIIDDLRHNGTPAQIEEFVGAVNSINERYKTLNNIGSPISKTQSLIDYKVIEELLLND